MDTQQSSIEPSASGDRFVYSAEICSLYGIGDQALRKWVGAARFPSPTANINGRNVWLASVVAAHRADVLAGRYAERRYPGVSIA